MLHTVRAVGGIIAVTVVHIYSFLKNNNFIQILEVISKANTLTGANTLRTGSPQ